MIDLTPTGPTIKGVSGKKRQRAWTRHNGFITNCLQPMLKTHADRPWHWQETCSQNTSIGTVSLREAYSRGPFVRSFSIFLIETTEKCGLLRGSIPSSRDTPGREARHHLVHAESGERAVRAPSGNQIWPPDAGQDGLRRTGIDATQDRLRLTRAGLNRTCSNGRFGWTTRRDE